MLIGAPSRVALIRRPVLVKALMGGTFSRPLGLGTDPANR